MQYGYSHLDISKINPSADLYEFVCVCLGKKCDKPLH